MGAAVVVAGSDTATGDDAGDEMRSNLVSGSAGGGPVDEELGPHGSDPGDETIGKAGTPRGDGGPGAGPSVGGSVRADAGEPGQPGGGCPDDGPGEDGPAWGVCGRSKRPTRSLPDVYYTLLFL